jgi:hypothetical protein
MDKRVFSTTEVAKILGKNPRFVIDWTERGLFHADVQPASGPGSKRLFVLTLKEKLELPRKVVLFVAEWVRQENIIWPWHSDEALKKYNEDTLRRMDEDHKKKILAEIEAAMNGTFIYTIGGKRHSMGFYPMKMIDLAKGGAGLKEKFPVNDRVEAMICVDLSNIKANVDRGIEQLPA